MLPTATSAAIAASLLIVVAAAPGPASAEPAPPNSAFFANCLAASAAARTFDRDGRYLRFTCNGDTARAFFDALGLRSPEVAYEENQADGVYRFTEKPKKDTSGLDYCRRSTAPPPGGDFSCVLIYPAGVFLDR